MDACRGGVRNTASLPPGASLDLSFMIPGTLDPSITFARASTGTYFDATGTMQTAPTNGPRWDYDPITLALRGLLLEDARTNGIRNSTMYMAGARERQGHCQRTGAFERQPRRDSADHRHRNRERAFLTSISELAGTTMNATAQLLPETTTAIAATNGQPGPTRHTFDLSREL